MKLSQPKTINMTQGNTTRQLLSFALPLFLGYLLQQLYNMVDSLVIGNYEGNAALAAVGIGHYPVNVLLNFFLGLSGAATIIISRNFGSGDREALRETIDNATSLVLLFSVPFILTGLFLSRPLLRAMNTPEEAFQLSFDYMFPLIVGITGALGYNMNAAILRGVGDSGSPLLFLTIASVVNIVLDLFFVCVLHMSALGTSLATVIAQWISWLYSVYYINRHYPEYRIHPLRIRFHLRPLKNLLRIGLPIAFNQGIFALGHAILSGLVNSNGTAFAAGYNVSNRIDCICFYTLAAMSQAVTTFTGQNLGARKYDRLKEGFRTGMVVCLLLTVLTSLLVTLPVRSLCGIFNSDEAVIRVGAGAIYRFGPYYIFYSVFYLTCAFLNGLGDVRISFIANLVLFWAVRLPSAYLLNRFTDPINLFFCYPISWVAGLIIVLPYYFAGKWKKYLGKADEIG